MRGHLVWIEQHDGIARAVIWDHVTEPRAVLDGADSLSLVTLGATDELALVALETSPTLARIWASDGVVELVPHAAVATRSCSNAQRTWFVDRELDVYELDHTSAALPRRFSSVPIVEQVVSMYVFETGLVVHGIATEEGAVRGDSVLVWLPFTGAAPEIIGRFSRPPLHTLAAVGDRLFATLGDELVSARVG